jgi:hypothetical protein
MDHVTGMMMMRRRRRRRRRLIMVHDYQVQRCCLEYACFAHVISNHIDQRFSAFCRHAVACTPDCGLAGGKVSAICCNFTTVY